MIDGRKDSSIQYALHLWYRFYSLHHDPYLLRVIHIMQVMQYYIIFFFFINTLIPAGLLVLVGLKKYSKWVSLYFISHEGRPKTNRW